MRFVLTEKECLGSVLCKILTHPFGTSHFTHKNIWIKTNQLSLVRGTIIGSIVVQESDFDKFKNCSNAKDDSAFGHYITFTHRNKRYCGFYINSNNFDIKPTIPFISMCK